MKIEVFQNKRELGMAAAACGAEALRTGLAARHEASIIVATGVSQFEMLDTLVAAPDIDWSNVTVFHLDEYIGLPATHPASFRRYLRERFVARLPALREFIAVEGDAPDLNTEIARLNTRISAHHIDVCFAGIGENGHLAFNDPPADFDIDAPYIAVDLDDACRRQQLGEGWFATLDDVPTRAISMSIRQIMKSARIVVSAPDTRKATAVAACVAGPVSPLHPASILQRHPDCRLFLDTASAALLPPGNGV